MSEIKPVYQSQTDGVWHDITKKEYAFRSELAGVYKTRILYPAAALEAQTKRANALALVIRDLTKMVTNDAETKDQLIERVKKILSVDPDLRVSEFESTLQAENAKLKSTISDLTKAYERESNDCLKALEERDYWYDKADALADKISEVFDVPIGEHSNVNCPIVEAMKILCGEYVTKFDKESAAQEKRIAELEAIANDHKGAYIASTNEIEVLRKQVEILKQTSPTSNGFCGRSGGCVCGGDLPRVRESCSNWVKSTQKGTE